MQADSRKLDTSHDACTYSPVRQSDKPTSGTCLSARKEGTNESETLGRSPGGDRPGARGARGRRGRQRNGTDSQPADSGRERPRPDPLQRRHLDARRLELDGEGDRDSGRQDHRHRRSERPHQGPRRHGHEGRRPQGQARAPRSHRRPSPRNARGLPLLDAGRPARPRHQPLHGTRHVRGQGRRAARREVDLDDPGWVEPPTARQPHSLHVRRAQRRGSGQPALDPGRRLRRGAREPGRAHRARARAGLARRRARRERQPDRPARRLPRRRQRTRRSSPSSTRSAWTARPSAFATSSARRTAAA